MISLVTNPPCSFCKRRKATSLCWLCDEPLCAKCATTINASTKHYIYENTICFACVVAVEKAKTMPNAAEKGTP